MRTFTTNLSNLIDSREYVKRTMVLFTTTTTNYGFWDDQYDVTFEGNVYKAMPGAVIVGSIQSGVDLSAKDVEVTLSPIQTVALDTLNTLLYYRKPAFIYYAYIDPTSRSIVGVELVFSGLVGNPSYSESRDDWATIKVPIRSHNWSLDARGTRTRSDADQQQLVAGDLFFSYTKSAVNQPVWWGRAGPQRPSQVKGE